MSLIKVTLSDGTRADFLAQNIIAVVEAPEGCEILVAGDAYAVKESGRSVRGYVKKALAASDAVEKPAF